MTVLTGHKALRCELRGGTKSIVVESGGQERAIEFDVLLCAVGRSARLKGFGLEELGIPAQRTVQTNEYLETIYPNILAAGDVAGPYQFTHTAAHQAWYAAVNALFGTFKKFKADYSVIPWATFIDPEVARVGLNEQEAKEKNIAYEVTKYGIDDLDRAIADSAAVGWVKVLTVPGKDKILGVTIVGVHAGDLLAEYVLAMKHGLGLNKILGTIHTYPDSGRGQQVRCRRVEARAPAAQAARIRRQVPRLETCMRKLLTALLLSLVAAFAQAQTFDHAYASWDALLKKHVRWLPDNKQSRADYAGFAKDRAELKTVLDAMSAVPKAEFDKWPREQRMAFLINAYNAFTVEVILTKWPDIKSIKELGLFNRGPWKNEFFTLLGAKHHLDWIEHEELRPKYADPRVHGAVNCASIGCPALRTEAFTAAKLEAQLDDGMQRFMGDRTRNRVAGGKVEVSSIFKWFKEDFEKGHKGFAKVEDVFAKYAALLSDKPEEQAALKAGSLPVAHLDYDWSINAVGR